MNIHRIQTGYSADSKYGRPIKHNIINMTEYDLMFYCTRTNQSLK